MSRHLQSSAGPVAHLGTAAQRSSGGRRPRWRRSAARPCQSFGGWMSPGPAFPLLSPLPLLPSTAQPALSLSFIAGLWSHLGEDKPTRSPLRPFQRTLIPLSSVFRLCLCASAACISSIPSILQLLKEKNLKEHLEMDCLEVTAGKCICDHWSPALPVLKLPCMPFRSV